MCLFWLKMSRHICLHWGMQKQTEYANWWSKLLFKKKFENQFFIPLPATAIERLLMTQIEKWKFSQDYQNIKIEKPIFIVGLPRSGTTLIYNLLCAHESAAYVTNSMNSFPEAPRAIEWLRKKFNWNVRGERFLADSIEVDFGSPSEPLTFWGPWMGRDVESLHWPERNIQDLGPERVQTIYRDIKKILSTFGGSRRFVMKYPVMQMELKVLQELFPDAKFIHILRDSRPAANSLIKLFRLSNQQLNKIKHPNIQYIVPYPRIKNLHSYLEKYGPDSVECTARVWNDAVELVQNTAPSLKNYYEFKYEDLLENPKTEMEKIFQFCELSWPNQSNENFKKHYQNIGKAYHKNEYKEYDKITEITAPLLKKLNYI